MSVKDPENYKLRGVRMTNELWEEICSLALVNGRSASKEVVAAVQYRLKRAKARGKI